MSDFYTLHKGIFRDIKEVDVLIDLIESQQAAITSLKDVLLNAHAALGGCFSAVELQKYIRAELKEDKK